MIANYLKLGECHPSRAIVNSQVRQREDVGSLRHGFTATRWIVAQFVVYYGGTVQAPLASN
jgi:hypothetical protein